MENNTKTGHPKGLYLLFVTEMWERFSYYGMRAIFTLFMVNALMFDKSLASTIYGNYTGLVYLTPLIGGYVADRYWGNRRSIFVGGVMMAIGQFFMFLAGSFYTDVNLASTLMFAGLGFLIFGNGFFKPNISTMVGQLYPEGDKRVDSAFTIFYMGINLGAFIAPLITGSLGEVYDKEGLIIPAMFKWGFLAACIGMVISTIIFELLKNKYIVTPTGEAIGAKPKKIESLEETVKTPINVGVIVQWVLISGFLFVAFKGLMGLDIVGAFIYTLCIVAPASIIVDKSLSKEEKQRIWVIFIIAFFVIFFWSAFEQAGASLTFFAQEQTDRHFFKWEIPSSYFQSINAVAIVIFAPIFAWLWTKLGASNREPSSPVKQSLGLFLLAVGYLIIAIGVKDLDPSLKVSMFWLVTLYTVHTFGELCLSPIGLSMVVKLAPVRFASLLMGVWFLSTATANKFAGDLSALYPEEVKLEKSIDINAFNFKNIDSANIISIKNLDSNFVKENAVRYENNSVSVELLSDNFKEEKEPSFLESFKNKLFGIEKEEKKDSLLSISVSKESKVKVSDYTMKLIVGSKPKFNYSKFINEEGNLLYLMKYEKGKKNEQDAKKLEIWNIKPLKPSFLGVQIENLYNFFMIFVFMAGTASVILFLISKRLLKMMHGVK
jgi:POT family proton-dependent oligopeptide transporter